METVNTHERILVKDGESTFSAYKGDATKWAASANRFIDFFNQKAVEIGLELMTKELFISLYHDDAVRTLENKVNVIIEKTPAPVRKLYQESYYVALNEIEVKIEEVRGVFRRGDNYKYPYNLTGPDALPFNEGEFEITEEWLESIRGQFNTYATDPVSVELLRRYQALHTAVKGFLDFTRDNNIPLHGGGDIHILLRMQLGNKEPLFIPEKVLPLK